MMKKINKHSFTILIILALIIYSLSSCQKKEEEEMVITPPPPPTTALDSIVTNYLVNFNSSDGLDGITIDLERNIYVSNFGQFSNGLSTGRTVYKITPEGEKSDFARFTNTPGGLTIDKEDNLYASVQNKIYKVHPDGTKEVYATNDLGFSGLTFDEEGNLYSCGFSHDKIYKVSPNGKVEIFMEDSRLVGTVGITYHHESNALYAGNFNDGNIIKVGLDSSVSILTNLGSTIGYLTEMNGDLYATMFNLNKIMKISITDGKATFIVGSGASNQQGGFLNTASFISPNGIAGDSENNTLYVSDYIPARVSKISL